MNSNFQPNVLQWARLRARLSEAVLAKKMNVKEERVLEWETTGKLTLRQAEKLAAKTNTPVGYLFLQKPLQELLPIPDFRTLLSEELARPSVELMDVIHQTQRQQDWYREHMLSDDADPLPFVGSATTRSDVTELAKDIHKIIGFDIEQCKQSKDWEEALRNLINAIERAGILVMRIGYAGSNTRRTLDVSEFRGFALSDPYAPLIFINGKDAKPAQMFTLAHELVHIWLAESGVSTLDKTFAPENARKIEFFCNRVAAEFLVPAADLKEEFRRDSDPRPQITPMARLYRVSALVMSRRFKDLGFLSWDEYKAYYEAEESAFFGKKKGSGGDPYATMQTKNSRRFSKALIASTLEGKTSYGDAFALLGIKTSSTFKKYAEDLSPAF